VSLLVYTRITHSRQCCNLYLDNLSVLSVIKQLLMILDSSTYIRVAFWFVLQLQESPCPANTVCIRISPTSRTTICVGMSFSARSSLSFCESTVWRIFVPAVFLLNINQTVCQPCTLIVIFDERRATYLLYRLSLVTKLHVCFSWTWVKQCCADCSKSTQDVNEPTIRFYSSHSWPNRALSDWLKSVLRKLTFGKKITFTLSVFNPFSV